MFKGAFNEGRSGHTNWRFVFTHALKALDEDEQER
jgi:hypothetical protein